MKSLKLEIEHFGENHTEVGIIYYNLGLSYFYYKKFPEAEACFRKFIYIHQETQNPDISECYYSLGEVLRA